MSFADPYRDAEVEEWAARKIQVSFKREMLMLMFDCVLHFTSLSYQLSRVRGFIDT